MSDIIGPRNWLLSHPIRWANGLWWWGERQERPIVRRYAELLQDTLVSWEKPNMDGPRLQREPISHAQGERRE